MQLIAEELEPARDLGPTCAGAHAFRNLVIWEKYFGEWSMEKVCQTLTFKPLAFHEGY
jgi:hypothetical protein